MKRSIERLALALACGALTTVAAWGESREPAKDPNARVEQLEKELTASALEVSRLREQIRNLQAQNQHLRAALARRAQAPATLPGAPDFRRPLRGRLPGEQAVPPDWIPRGSGNVGHYLIPLKTETHAPAATNPIASPAPDHAGRPATKAAAPPPRSVPPAR